MNVLPAIFLMISEKANPIAFRQRLQSPQNDYIAAHVGWHLCHPVEPTRAGLGVDRRDSSTSKCRSGSRKNHKSLGISRRGALVLVVPFSFLEWADHKKST